MEAPTPASALIHSSTLVVMGIFMLMRFSFLFSNVTYILLIMQFVGALTILYGSIFSTLTGDLKKAVAFSTISQVGYLYCGCGLLAIRETLIYLVIHAICKAMLFVFVGYIIHLFGGTTSLRRMGGLFYIAPDISLYVVTLCLILSGAPYTIGFIAKEFILYRMMSCFGPLYYLT
jgi:NADH:ubiquinone oxidoreductase subunit 5 (subunit L)/multisubunit Na+/H+ antiporter MnhA subunit